LGIKKKPRHKTNRRSVIRKAVRRNAINYVSRVSFGENQSCCRLKTNWVN